MPFLPGPLVPHAFRLLSLAAILLLAGCAAYAPPRAGEKIHRNIRFASPKGRDLHLDLYVPQSAKPVPVVMWIFGGSWKRGFKGYHLNVRDLTRHGIAVAAIEYRLSDEAKYPAQIDDCRAALSWLRENGPRFGLDPRRIGVSGESAGGHLAALLGTREGTPHVRAVCALYPPTDLLSLGRQYAYPEGPSDIERLLGGPIEEKESLAMRASPINHVHPTTPPFLLIHGQDDTLVSPEHSAKLHRRLQQAGVESHLILVPGKGHWFLLNPPQLTKVARFFQDHFAVVTR